MAAKAAYVSRLLNGIRSWLNDLSLLVVVGTSVSFYFFSAYFGDLVPTPVVLALALSVWSIYTADHLRDGWIHKERSSMSRHRLHYSHRQILGLLLLLALGSLAYLAIARLAGKWVLFGAIQCGLIALYFAINQAYRKRVRKNLPFKEVGIAGVVTLSLAFSPVMGRALPIDAFLLITAFFLINWVNLLQFSYFDHAHDRASGFASIGAYLNQEQMAAVISVLIAVQVPLLGWLIWSGDLPVIGPLILGLMVLLQVIVQYNGTYFSRAERYRFWGDLIYLFPAIYFF